MTNPFDAIGDTVGDGLGLLGVIGAIIFLITISCFALTGNINGMVETFGKFITGAAVIGAIGATLLAIIYGLGGITRLWLV